METLLKDPLTEGKKDQRKIPVKVVADDGVVNINIKGYGNCVVTLEVWNGQLRLLVWANKSDEPTHIINLEGAKKVKKAKTNLAIR